MTAHKMDFISDKKYTIQPIETIFNTGAIIISMEIRMIVIMISSIFYIQGGQEFFVWQQILS